MLHVRDERPAKADVTVRGVGKSSSPQLEKPSGKQQAPKRDASGAKTIEDELVPDVGDAKAPVIGSSIAGRKRSRVPLIILIALLVLGGAFAGLYYGGVIAL